MSLSVGSLTPPWSSNLYKTIIGSIVLAFFAETVEDDIMVTDIGETAHFMPLANCFDIAKVAGATMDYNAFYVAGVFLLKFHLIKLLMIS